MHSVCLWAQRELPVRAVGVKKFKTSHVSCVSGEGVVPRVDPLITNDLYSTRDMRVIDLTLDRQSMTGDLRGSLANGPPRNSGGD